MADPIEILEKELNDLQEKDQKILDELLKLPNKKLKKLDSYQK
jgi:hypothetical protein